MGRRREARAGSELDIIDTLPGEKGYNDFRRVWKIWVPNDYTPNTITDAGTLQHAGYKMEKTDKLLNMAVVPDGVLAREFTLAAEKTNCNAPGIRAKSQNISCSTRRRFR